ncbi:MAG: hypothetical protein HGB12_05580, partial [Bacteroidetes bacterium]|nr:hypothetical protein [Bacteroidota bacterium]
MAKKITTKAKVNALKAKTKKATTKVKSEKKNAKNKLIAPKTKIKLKEKKVITKKALLTKPVKKTAIKAASKKATSLNKKIIKKAVKKPISKKATPILKLKAKKLVPKAKTKLKKVVAQTKVKPKKFVKKQVVKLVPKKAAKAAKKLKVQPKKKIEKKVVKALKPIIKSKKTLPIKSVIKNVIVKKNKSKIKPDKKATIKTKKAVIAKVKMPHKKIAPTKAVSKKGLIELKVPNKKKYLKKKDETFTPKVKSKTLKPAIKEVAKNNLPSKIKKELLTKPVNETLALNTLTLKEKPLKIEKIKIVQKTKIIQNNHFLKVESNFNRADMFYKNVLKAQIVKRYSIFNEDDKEKILKDQDLTINLNDVDVTISEKSRDLDWNDIFVEIFKKHPGEAGWVKYTEADYLAYFFPGRVFWAKMEPIKALCEDILSKAINSGIYKELYYMYTKNSGRLSKTFKINTKTYSFNFIQTYHEDGDNSYYSIGISLPFV